MNQTKEEMDEEWKKKLTLRFVWFLHAINKWEYK